MTSPAVAPELQAEINGDLDWMYEWELGGQKVQLLNPELETVHPTKLDLIEEPVRAVLDAAGPRATGIDLACSEGWFAHRLLDWGAQRVVAYDLRERNVRRARLVRDHLGIHSGRLDFEEADLYKLDVDALGTFDVVILFGIIYHVEDPVGAIRRARALTRGICVIDTALTRQQRPLMHTWGVYDEVLEAPASFAAKLEADAATNPVASGTGIVSMVPNRAAVELMLEAAGFRTWEWREPLQHHNHQYTLGDRGVIVALP
jgi:tRNA (mo5U34)-methyltransferase